MSAKLFNVIITVLLLSANCQALPDSSQNGDDYLIKVLLNSVLNSQSDRLSVLNEASETVASLVKLVNHEAGVDLLVISNASLTVSPSAIGELLRSYSQLYIRNEYKNNPVMVMSLTILTENKIKETVATLENLLGEAALPLELANRALTSNSPTKSATAISGRAISVSSVFSTILSTLISPIQTRINYVFDNVTAVLTSLYSTDNSTNTIAVVIANVTDTVVGKAITFVETVQTNVNQFFDNLVGGTSSTATDSSKQIVLKSQQEVSNQRANFISKIVSFIANIVQSYVDETFTSVISLLEGYYITDLPSNPIAAIVANAVNKVVLGAESFVNDLQELVDGIFE